MTFKALDILKYSFLIILALVSVRFLFYGQELDQQREKLKSRVHSNVVEAFHNGSTTDNEEWLAWPQDKNHPAGFCQIQAKQTQIFFILKGNRYALIRQIEEDGLIKKRELVEKGEWRLGEKGEFVFALNQEGRKTEKILVPKKGRWMRKDTFFFDYYGKTFYPKFCDEQIKEYARTLVI